MKPKETPKKLEGRTALITGASRGIGRAIAEAFACEGADLALTARSENDLEKLRAQLESHHGIRCRCYAADLTEAGTVSQVVSRFGREFEAIDILVNNAGIGSGKSPKPVPDFDDEYWDRSLLLNLKVPYLFCKALLPPMLERRWGRIINIASLAGKIGLLHAAAYSASKHGLLGLTRTVAAEVAGTGVTANAICPGPVKTKSNQERVEYDAKRTGQTVEEIERRITPLGRRLIPEEIAPVAVYLASEAACGVNGQAWNIDGGVLPF